MTVRRSDVARLLKRTAKVLIPLVVLVPICSAQTNSLGAISAAQVIEKMDNDVIELARQFELAYSTRCNQSTMDACGGANYQACLSSFPSPSCPSGSLYTDSLCGDGTTCSKLWDFTTSVVLIPEQVANGPYGNPTDPMAIEGICATRLLNSWYQKKVTKDKPFWSGYGLFSPGQYVGGEAGYFRLLTARQSRSCGGFDPRKRPWYASAISGPKNIILLLDTSQSMGHNGKLDILKQAALTIVSRLSVGDRIAVIPFNDTANVIDSGLERVYPATSKNKELLLTLISSLSAGGGMNLLNGFTKAFDVLNASATNGTAVKCHSAVLVMSGSRLNQNTNGSSTDDRLLQFISSRTSEMMKVIGGKIVLFTYSISPDESTVNNSLLQKIACQTEYGVWNQIANGSSITASLQSYYMMFALALGNDKNRNFVAWSEPYIYYGKSTFGSTVSAPVYDRSKEPHIFIGVAGIDFEVAALDIALGTNDSSAAYGLIISAATAVCPVFELDSCMIQSLRKTMTGDGALCGNSNCTPSVLPKVLGDKCLNVNDYPSNLWANTDFSNISFEKRSCCKVGENKSSTSCPVGNSTRKSSAPYRALWCWVTVVRYLLPLLTATVCI